MKIIAIVGPTASGKSALAFFFARKYDGEIVSCDSVQIFKHLNIGSAKPSEEEKNLVKHHLIDVFEPDVQSDVRIYKELAEKAILDIVNRGKIPFVVGGTGMYFNALYYGLSDAPSRNEEIRKSLEKKAEKYGLELLYDELTKVDKETASKVARNDKRRIIRALEVYYISGKPLSEINKTNKKLEADWLVISLLPDRAKLYEKINMRVEEMIEKGLVDEVKSIVEKYGENAYALGSIGYKETLDYIKGKISFEEMKELIKKNTRNYAKRQYTWFKKFAQSGYSPEEIDTIDNKIKEFINR